MLPVNGLPKEDTRLVQQLSDLRQDQYDRWTRGEYVDARDYFQRWPDLFQNRNFALDFIYSQYCMAEKLSKGSTPDDYLKRFPEYAQELGRLFEVHQELSDFSIDSTLSKTLLLGGATSTPNEFVQWTDRRDDFSGDTTGRSIVGRLGRYELLEKVGQGSFGTVYRAQDTLLNREVAVKVPRASRFASEADEERFVREASAVAQLDHPGIVRIFDVGTDRDVPYIVAEFIHGSVLSRQIETQRFNFRDAADLVMKIAQAIQHAHRHGIIHRDLKPSNIMLTKDGQPRVLDFGLAKSDSTQGMISTDGMIIGAPAYMSPEQASGKGHQADARSDVYSLGVILYQLLTGEVPFRGTIEAIIRQLQSKEPLEPRQLDPRIPKDLNTVCLRALAKEPDRRFESAQEMADDLNRFLQKLPIRSRPVSRFEKMRLWSRRNPGVSLLSASVVTALVLGTVVSSIFAVRSSISETKARIQADLLRRSLYNNNIALIQHAVGSGQTSRASSLLERTSPEFRRWEWHYWKNALHRDLRTIPIEPNSIVAIQPTGWLIAVGNTDGSLQILDSRSGQCINKFSLHQSAITALSFNPEGTVLLSAAQDKSVRSWNVGLLSDSASPTPQVQYESIFGIVRAFVFQSDGQRFAMRTDNGWWQFRNTSESNMLFNLEWGASSIAAAFTPSKSEYLFAMENELVEMEIPGGAKHRVLQHEAAITGVSCSSDGNWIVSTSQDRTAKVWNRVAQTHRTLRGHTDSILCSAISPSSEIISTAGEDTVIRLWDTRTGSPLSSFLGHTSSVTQLAFLAGGELLASVSEDSIKLWATRDIHAQPFLTDKTTESFGRVAFSPDGRMLASAGGDGNLRLYDAVSGSELQILLNEVGNCTALAFADQGDKLLAVCDGLPYKWSRPQVTGSSDSENSATGYLPATKSVMYSPVGIEELRLPALEPGKLLCQAVAPSELLTAIAFDQLAVISDQNGNHLARLTQHTAPICSMAFSRDSSILATGCQNGSIHIWNVAMNEVMSAPVGHTQSVTDLSFGPNGDVLLSSSLDGTVQLWSVDDGMAIHTFAGHARAVNSACFDPSGDRILTCSDDRTLRLWDAREAVEIISLECDPGTQARFSPDGTRVVYGLSGGGIQWLDTSLRTSDEKMATWEARRFVDQQPLLSDAMKMLESQQHWSPRARSVAEDYISLASSTIPDCAKRVLSLLMVDSPKRLDSATQLAYALQQHEPNNELAKTLVAACLGSDDRHAEAAALLPVAKNIADAPTAMIALLNVRKEDMESSDYSRLVELVQGSYLQSTVGIEADYYRYFGSVLNKRLLLGQTLYQQSDLDESYRHLHFVSQFRPLSNDYRMMLVACLGVQRKWVEASELHAQVEHQPDDWVYLTQDALLSLAAQDQLGYRQACQSILSLDYQNAESTRALLAAMTCLIGEKAVDEPRRLVEFVQDLKKLPNAHPGLSILLGLAQFRCGELKQAQSTLRPMLLLMELANSELGSRLVGSESAEIKIAQLACVSTMMQIEQQLGQHEAAEKSALKTQRLIDQLDELKPSYDGRLSPWNARAAAHLARQLLLERDQRGSETTQVSPSQ